MEEVSTISFFRFEGLSAKAWAFKMMGLGPRQLKGVSGLKFFKMLGTGRDMGFNPFPDWSVYALLQVWGNEDQAKAFLDNSSFIAPYRIKSSEIWTIYMRSIDVKGQWSGRVPFQLSQKIDPNNKKVIVITRASIRLRSLIPFWKFVPKTLEPLKDNSNLLYTKGVGEWPFTQMVTFSLWNNVEAMQQFAYHSNGHVKAMQHSQAKNWFKESIFARFQPYRATGTWKGEVLI